MREYSLWSALWRAPLLQRGVYQDAALRWRGIGLTYLELVLTLTWLVVLITWTVEFSHYLSTDARRELADFPTMTITRGHLSSPVDQPFIYRTGGGQILFVLDTTGTVKLPSERGAQMLITDTEVIQEQPGTTRRTPLAALPDMVVDQAKVLGWLGTFRNWIIPGGYVVFGAISVLWRLGAALIFAAVGLSFAAALRARLSYAALLRLTMLAMTPVLLIDTVMWVVGWQFSCWTWFVYPVITLGYLFYGVKATAAVVAEAPPSFPVEMEAPAAEAPAAAPARDPLVPPETDRLFP